MALWSGRFEEGANAFTQRFGASLPVDKALFAQDIAGSKAHAKMLAAQGIISESDAQAIVQGLDSILEDIESGIQGGIESDIQDGIESGIGGGTKGDIESGIQDDIESGKFAFDINNEDIHMSIESELTARIGDAGARLHTGRSRNDQTVCDTRLYAKARCVQLMQANISLREALMGKASQNMDAIMPGYTHLQHAQPVLFSHHMLAYVWMLTRDFARLRAAFDAADSNPLGAAALAGTTYPLDRFATTEALGFAATIPNSLDAVSDRDFLLDLLYAASVSMIHLSRLCEEIILWSTSEFGFVTLSDSYSTGSSIMPQKKNPDFAELIRGKSGRVVGELMGLLMTCKSLPLAYNKDLQEDKQGVIDAADTLHDCYVCAAGMVESMQVNAENMMDSAGKGYMAATDLADYLAKRGMPFRHAHEVVGHLVLLCEKRGCSLEDLTLEDLRAESELFGEDVAEALNLQAIVDARNTYGGTGTQAVKVQMEEAACRLAADAEALQSL